MNLDFKKISGYIRRAKIIVSLILVIVLFVIWTGHYAQLGTPNAKHNDTISTKNKTTQIKSKLNKYMKSVTKDGTAEISFYNLTPKANSKAAKAADASVYKAGNLNVESRSHKGHVSASTYKLFIAAYLYQEKKKGNFNWTASSRDGFRRMVVNSENDFSEAELRKYGMDSINNFVATQNWYSPMFKASRDAKTTSHSLMLLLESLDSGTGPFMNKADRTKLLHYMSIQRYRTGIPAGTNKAMKGTKVADKVGFLNDTNNDAAIVSMPNGQRYILVIMTHGHKQGGLSGFPRIAKIAYHIQKIAYQTK